MNLSNYLLASAREHNAYFLSGLVEGCGLPDSPDSPGADALDTVRASFVESALFALRELHVEGLQVPDDLAVSWDVDEVRHALGAWRDGDGPDGAAASMVPVDTLGTWRIFVDLTAWRVDVDPGLLSGDMSDNAATILGELGRALVAALYDEVVGLLDELTETDDDTEGG